jgi:type I restriction enzyme S subunit
VLKEKTKFKETEIGLIPEEWEETSLGNVCKKIGDGLHGTPQYSENGEYYFINGNNIENGRIIIKLDTKKVSEQEFKKHKKDLNMSTLFLSINGTIGNLAKYNNEKCILGKSAAYLNVGSNADRDYVYYLLLDRNFQHEISRNANGSTIKNVSLKQLRDYSFYIPPLPEQKAIAAVLSSLDDKIELLREQNKTLEAIAQALFKEWFIDFNFPDDNGNLYKKSGGKMTDSELGEIPEEWRFLRLDELIAFNPSEKINYSQEYLFYDMKCLSGNSMLIDDGIYRNVKSASSFRKNDTLMAKITPCLENGKTGFVLDLKGHDVARGSTEFIVMRAEKQCSPFFVYNLSRYNDFRDFAIKSMTGTSGRQRVQLDLLKDYKVGFNKEVMIEFDLINQPIFNKIKNNDFQIKVLTKLRDNLLSKLMKGEIRVQKT